MVALPLEIEIAHSAGRGDLQKTYRLVTLGTQFSWTVFFFVAAFLMLVGPILFRYWAHGQIAFSYGMMALFLAMSWANQFGRIAHTA